MSGRRRGVVALAAMLAGGVLLAAGPAALAQNDDTFTDNSSVTTDITREARETTTITHAHGDATEIEGGAIITGDIVSGRNTGNAIALDTAAGAVTIDGGDLSIPTYIGMNVGSDANDVYREGEVSDNDASTDNSIDSSRSGY